MLKNNVFSWKDEKEETLSSLSNAKITLFQSWSFPDQLNMPHFSWS